jgi:hypothetical protein
MERAISDIENAKQILEEDQRKRLELCREAIRRALEQHGCELIAVLQTNLGAIAVPVELRVK